MRLFLKSGFVAALFLVFSVSLLAQDNTSTIEAVKLRANTMLKVAREKKWDELYKYVVVVTGKHDKATRRRMEISDNATEEEIREKVAGWFKRLYEAPQPYGVVDVRLDDKDKSRALIEYIHEDIDGFYMVFVGGEWYYTLEY